MSDFAQIIGCDKVGQQPLVQSVLKGSKKLKPRGSKRRRPWNLSYSTSIFMGVSINKNSCSLFLAISYFKIHWIPLEAFRVGRGKFKTRVPGLALQLGAWAFFQETPSLLRAWPRQGLCFGQAGALVLLWQGRCEQPGWGRGAGASRQSQLSSVCCVAWGRSLKLSVSSSVK